MISLKAKTKSWAFALIMAVTLFVAALMSVPFAASAASAESSTNIGRTYYYNELKNSELAQKFYGVMDEMANNGSFDNGITEYDLAAIVTDNEIYDYLVNGAPKIAVALGAARDAYYMDHPELFYADVHKLTLKAGYKDDKGVAYLGTGRIENYYSDNTVTNADEVKTAKAAFETELGKAVAAAKANNADTVTQIANVNKYIADKTTYDFGVTTLADNTYKYDGYVRSAYGALVTGKAVCEGYAKAFKAVMDRLDIPCVLIAGTACSGIAPEGEEAGNESHMWNAVQVGGLWYAVDVTWNDGENNLNKYLLVGDDFLSVTHFPDGVLSSSGFELKYPALRPLDYGVNEDSNGFLFEDEKTVGNTQFGYSEENGLILGVSYDGKNGKQLIDEGKYLVMRQTDYDGNWTDWYSEVMFLMGNTDADGLFEGIYTVSSMISGEQVQYAVVDYAPDHENGFSYTENIKSEHIIAISTIYKNEHFSDDDRPAPHVIRMTPNEHGYIKDISSVEITLEYSEKLAYVEGKGKNDVGVTITGYRDEELPKLIKIQNVNWDEENNTLKFRFTPSPSFAHNRTLYYFIPVNLVSEASGKVPYPSPSLGFEREYTVCPKVFNDGRLYMKVYGNPEFVSASDESCNGFKDKNGQPIVGDLRTQLMLVVNESNKEESDSLKDALVADSDLNIEKSDIKASSTYQIDMYMCGMLRKVPSGSYMQLGFGFPEGYGPDDAGVTFTVYHYTRNPDGTVKDVETVPCVMTEWGIIATVKSFSPFMICAIDAKKAPAGRVIYANSEIAGGKVSGNATDIGNIHRLNSGDSITYNITPDSGYILDKVLLNGTDITAKVANNALTLGYDDLQGEKYSGSNELEVSFISQRVDKYNKDNGIQVVQPRIIVTDNDMIEATAGDVAIAPAPGDGGKSNTAVIVTVVIVTVVSVLTAGVLLFYFLVYKKKLATAPAGGKGANKTASKTAKVSTANKNESKSAKVSSAQMAATRSSDSKTAAPGTRTAATRPSASTTANKAGTTPNAPRTAAARPTTTNTKNDTKK